jgi:hypothetical protein
MKRGLVLDASVVINVLASGQPRAILRASATRRVVIAVTSREVFRHPLRPGDRDDPLGPLVQDGTVERIELPEEAEGRFVELVGGLPPNDLGDGEAATLAAAEALGMAAALDERKGRRVARDLMPDVELVSSLDLFRSESVGQALGVRLADAVFSSLLHARMRVPGDHVDWVVTLVGQERASRCPSLRCHG